MTVSSSDKPLNTILEHAQQTDLMILGIHRNKYDKKLLSHFAAQIIDNTDCPLLLARLRS